MSDTPTVHGVPQPKGTSWLNEVRLDAARNLVENLQKQARQQEFEQAKANGITVQDVLENGRKELDDQGFLDAHKEFIDETGFDYDEDQLNDDDANTNGRTNNRKTNTVDTSSSDSKSTKETK